MYHTKTTKQKMSKTRKKLWQNPEYRERMKKTHKAKGTGKWMKNRKPSKEIKQKISNSLKGHIFWGKRYQTEITKKKISISLKNFNNSTGKVRTRKQQGYVFIHAPFHPKAQKSGYVKRANIVMEQHIGRFLKPKEIVHHINGIKDDDRLKNLQLFTNESKHQKFHFKLKKLRSA